jgi:hypothetical protein
MTPEKKCRKPPIMLCIWVDFSKDFFESFYKEEKTRPGSEKIYSYCFSKDFKNE